MNSLCRVGTLHLTNYIQCSLYVLCFLLTCYMNHICLFLEVDFNFNLWIHLKKCSDKRFNLAKTAKKKSFSAHLFRKIEGRKKRDKIRHILHFYWTHLSPLCRQEAHLLRIENAVDTRCLQNQKPVWHVTTQWAHCVQSPATGADIQLPIPSGSVWETHNPTPLKRAKDNWHICIVVISSATSSVTLDPSGLRLHQYDPRSFM